MEKREIHHGLTGYRAEKCRCEICRRANADQMAKWREANRDHSAAYLREWKRNLRAEVIAHYGGCCACCGTDYPEFLVLDHKDGGGSQHRKATGMRGNAMWAWAKREGYPDLFRLLCWNCNQARGYYGKCPHES